MGGVGTMSKYSKIYVLCIGGLKTGGTELLHQLVFRLNREGQMAYIVYIGNDLSMPEAFKNYIETPVKRLDEIEDDAENLIIIPETKVEYVNKFSNAMTAIWWLSVDNFAIHNDFRSRKELCSLKNALYNMITGEIKDKTKFVLKADFHLCQSYYAIDYIKRKYNFDEEKIIYLSDYINDCYTKSYVKEDKSVRNDVILYNPAKGYKFTRKLIKATPDLEWIPLQGMTNEEIYQYLNNSKVYVDFGNHPGKDRFPREAAISGCCIITGKRGAAKFNKDVPILDKYKFDEKIVEQRAIIHCIRYCLEKYEEIINDFEQYRQIILNEKSQFINDVKNIFII